MEVVTAEYSNVQQQLIQHEKKIATAKSSYEKLLKQHEKFQENFKKKSTKIENQINELLDSIKKLDAENSNLRSQRTKLEADIASLQKQLAGIIVCPKCQHEFTLANDIDINEVKLRLQDRNGETQDILQNIEANENAFQILQQKDAKLVKNRMN